MVQVDGKFQFVTSENFEEYLKALGQLEVAGNFALSQPIVEIQSNGDQYTITVDSNGKIATSTFKLGEFYDESLPSYGATLKVVFQSFTIILHRYIVMFFHSHFLRV